MQTFDLMLPVSVNPGDSLSTHRHSQTDFQSSQLPVVKLPLVLPLPQSQETTIENDQSNQTMDLFNMISDGNLFKINQ